LLANHGSRILRARKPWAALKSGPVHASTGWGGYYDYAFNISSHQAVNKRHNHFEQ
jgi:hypothetical protein